MTSTTEVTDPALLDFPMVCAECGERFEITDGIANHWDEDAPTGIDHDLDEDHVPYEY